MSLPQSTQQNQQQMSLPQPTQQNQQQQQNKPILPPQQELPLYIVVPIIFCFLLVVLLAIINNILHPQLYYGNPQGSLFSLNLGR
jgi:hypothetical protein